MTTTTTAAMVFAFGTGVVILFQLALVCGAPWGEYTLGGRHRGQLPGAWRVVPVISIALLAAFVWIVLVRSGMLGSEHFQLSRTLIWIVVGYSALGCVANVITTSVRERKVWLPVVAVMLITSGIVAFDASGAET